MTENPSRRFDGTPSTWKKWRRKFRLLVPLQILLVLLALAPLTGLLAQPGPGGGLPEKKTEKKDLRPDAPKPSEKSSDGFVSQPLSFRASNVRFQFKIDPKTPLKDLLPAVPKSKKLAAPAQGGDLSEVPEVQFQTPLKADAEAMKHIAHQIAKINHLNDKKADGFMEALREDRLDLFGLPFAMGDACRTKGERSKQFALAVATVRRALQGPRVSQSANITATRLQANASNSGNQVIIDLTNAAAPTLAPITSEKFWEQYRTLCTQEDRGQGRNRRESRETARIAALMQILAPMPDMQTGLVEYLSTVSHIEATRALARLAIFCTEGDARKAALDALKVRRERDYTDILVRGLRYPWPAVAGRAAVAIAKLERKDLLPKLLDLLEQDDPRTPAMEEFNHKRVPVVRELVRVNHHRNCLLCHAPGNTGKVSSEAVTAEVPVPGQPLTPPSAGYNTSQPDILVRVDVTYLRQDFSALQPVADANPWPEMQRFDFLVRRRALTEKEAVAYREKLTPHESGRFSPYRRAALAALRDLTGRDTEPTPEAWRRLLQLSSAPRSETKTP